MQEIVKVSGATSRTLRHYQAEGLLEPSRIGHGGRRFYDRRGLLRLQRIQLLRELRMSLQDIGRVLDGDVDAADALRRHVEQLEQERERLDTIADSVRATATMLEEGGELVADTMFNGFDHTRHREEVEQRWGRDAYANSDAWWRSLSAEAKQAHQDEMTSLAEGFAAASAEGLDVRSPQTQELARRQFEWVRAGWGGTAPGADAFIGLGQMYVDDPRFGEAYTVEGRNCADYVRDAMTVFAQENLD
ncbi:MerR family transcriptional regulator [Dietzia sp. NPDC055343]